MTALATALIILLSISIWYFSALPRNYILACKTGLPPYLSPVSPNNPVWLVIFSVVGYPAMESILPRFLFDRVKLTMMGWEFHDRYEVNRRWGDKFILVTPGVNVVFVADPEVAQEVLGRRKEFQRLDVAGRKFCSGLSDSHEAWAIEGLTISIDIQKSYLCLDRMSFR
jgi:hypothetical protein